ncbi:unnamed protein product [Polarella glacialis]|uniref:BTB domain-containing protein n=1 Tax=Polarella glacialis TaxID=89957 RepID=A0A813LDU7_POLGL|nr:unnamed protein product [Polarella glacialis]
MDPLQLLESGADSDFTVTIGERSFLLHSFILKQGSPYFRSLQTSGMKECSGTCTLPVELVVPQIFEAILPFIYARRLGHVELKAEALYSMFELADYFQLADFESYMGQKEVQAAGDKPPFQAMLDCIQEHSWEQLRDANERSKWLVQECNRAAKADFAAESLKNVFFDALQDHCLQSNCYLSAACCAMTIPGIGPARDQALLQEVLNQVKGYNYIYVLQKDLQWMVTFLLQGTQPEPTEGESAIRLHTQEMKIKRLQCELEELRCTSASLEATVQEARVIARAHRRSAATTTKW